MEWRNAKLKALYGEKKTRWSIKLDIEVECHTLDQANEIVKDMCSNVVAHDDTSYLCIDAWGNRDMGAMGSCGNPQKVPYFHIKRKVG